MIAEALDDFNFFLPLSTLSLTQAPAFYYNHLRFLPLSLFSSASLIQLKFGRTDQSIINLNKNIARNSITARLIGTIRNH